ncbi:MAG: alpha/beta fold hydrolase [Pseudomonadota bacterium]
MAQFLAAPVPLSHATMSGAQAVANAEGRQDEGNDSPKTDFLPAALFLQSPDLRNVQISPDGNFISYTLRLEDTSAEDLKKLRSRRRLSIRKSQDVIKNLIRSDELRVISLETGQYQVGVPFENREVQSAIWVSPTKILVTFSLPYTLSIGSVGITTIGYRTLSFDVTTGAATVLFDNKRSISKRIFSISSVVHKLPDDPDHVMMQIKDKNDLDLYKVNIVNGDATRIEAGKRGTFRWLTDQRGNPQFRLDRNRRGTVMSVFVKSDTNSWTRIAEVPIRANKEANVDFAPLGNRDRKIYIRSRAEDEDFISIKTYDPAQQTFTASQLSAPNHDFRGGIYDSQTDELIGGFYYEDRFTVDLFDDDIEKALADLSAYFGDTVNVFLRDISESRDEILLLVRGPDTPDTYYFFNPKRRELEPLFAGRVALPQKVLSPTEIISYTARDGTSLRGYLTKPKQATATTPLIVFPHGGPEARDYYDYDGLIQYLAHRGYSVFQPQFRGSSGFGRRFAQAGYRNWGQLIQDDIYDGVRWLIDNGRATAGHMCIMGASFGGYSALMNPIRYPDTYKCIGAVASVTDLPDLLKFVRAEEGRTSEAYEYARRSIGDLGKDRDMLAVNSPARRAADISVPVLLVHGDQDSVAPIDQSEKMAQALAKLNKPHNFVVVENEGHSFLLLENKIRLAERLAGFADIHLLGKPQASAASSPH